MIEGVFTFIKCCGLGPDYNTSHKQLKNTIKIDIHKFTTNKNKTKKILCLE